MKGLMERCLKFARATSPTGILMVALSSDLRGPKTGHSRDSVVTKAP